MLKIQVGEELGGGYYDSRNAEAHALERTALERTIEDATRMGYKLARLSEVEITGEFIREPERTSAILLRLTRDEVVKHALICRMGRPLDKGGLGYHYGFYGYDPKNCR